MNVIRWLAASLAISSGLGGGALAADTGCTPISSLPFVVESPGTYCVTAYLRTDQSTGAAIEIRADDVVIDMNNWGLDGLAAGAGTQAIGVYAFDRSNISIGGGGAIRGFSYGIALENSSPDFSNTSGHAISGVLLELNRSVAIEVRGIGSTVTGNLVQSTGGAPFGGTAAITVFGPDAYLRQNTIVDTAAQAEDAGGTDIFLFGAARCQVLENRMVNTVAAHGQSVGVMVWGSPDCVVSQSEIDNRTTTALDVGVYIIDSKSVQTISNKMTNVVKHYLR